MGPSSCRKTSSGLLVILHNGALYNYFVVYHNPIPGNSAVKNLPSLQETTCNIGDTGSILGLRGSPGEGNGNKLQSSCIENPTDRGAQSMGLQKVRHDWVTHFSLCKTSDLLNQSLFCVFILIMPLLKGDFFTWWAVAIATFWSSSGYFFI